MASRPISPAEPSKKRLQPNAHPYAIKTTSSALLSSSSSSLHSAHFTKHHYVPSPPSSRIPTATRVRHRHSSSLSSVEGEVHSARTIPAPLPTPPSIASSYNSPASVKPADEPKLSQRARRANTMPSIVTEGHDYEEKRDQDSTPELYAGLPPNPKQWSTDQLITYLKTYFKSGNTTSGDKDDSGLSDILDCVHTRGLTGRELLRLTDADLAGTPLSQVQRAKLLECSRTLRADVLRGRIYVDSYHLHEVSDNSNSIYFQSNRASTPFHSTHGASVSADDLRLLFENNANIGDTALISSPVMSLHRSNSVSDASAQRYRDLARLRMRRRGQVKGLVETWERASTSGSECSASDIESEGETDLEFATISDTDVSSEFQSKIPFTLHDEPPHNACFSVVDSSIHLQDPPSLGPPPYTHTHGKLRVEGEEPSIEELLAASSDVPLTGALAWEADFGMGNTVKHVPDSTGAEGADAVGPLPPVTGSDASRQDDGQVTNGDSFSSKGSGIRRSTGSKGKNARARKRVVTAIFTGSPTHSGDVPENMGDEAHLRSQYRYASAANGTDCGDIPASSELQNDPDLRALEESIAVTRAQLEAFRLRLEQVEADTTKQEAVLMQIAGSCRSSDVELRQRRPEANKQATTVEPPRDKACLESDNTPESMSLADMARAIPRKAMGWLFPYGHLGVQAPEEQASTGSRPMNGECRSPAKRDGRLPVARMSCSIILVSFAICAALLRRMGFGRWVRRP